MTTALATTISASQVGAMLGHSPFMSPLLLFHKLRGELPELEDNETLKEGRYFEDAIAKIAREKFKIDSWQGPKKLGPSGVLTGTPDRYVVSNGKRAVLEIKNTLFGHEGEGGWGQPGTDEVPANYWYQAHTYAYLNMHEGAGAGDECLLAARLHSGVQLYRIKLDPDVAAKVEGEARAFLKRVEQNDPPTPRDEADMRMRWMVREDKVAIANEAGVERCKKLREVKKARKDLEQQESDLQTLLLGYAQDASRIEHHNEIGLRTVLCTMSANRKFDAEKFIEDNPHMAALYQKLDTTALQKAQRAVYDCYMRKPATISEQVRTIRLKEFEI